MPISKPSPSNRINTSPALSGHIPALDGVRGSAILMVMLFHGWILPTRTAAEDYVGRLIGFGWSGVDLFFVLSGFLITGILYDAKGRAHYFRNFYARRFFRIFPLYYATLVMAFLAIPHIFRVTPAAQDDQWWFWVYLSNFWLAHSQERTSTTLTVTWSLAIEEQFYLIWPLIVSRLDRRALMRVCVAMIVLSLLSRWAVVISDQPKDWAKFYSFCRLDPLGAGAFVALLLRSPFRRPNEVAIARRAAASAAGVLIAVGVFQKSFAIQAPMLAVGLTALAVCFGALLVLIVAGPPDSACTRFFQLAPLRTLGQYSYSMYLFHMPVNLFISDHVWGREHLGQTPLSIWVGQLVFYALSFAATLAVALVTWHIYEKWFLRLKKYFPSH